MSVSLNDLDAKLSRLEDTSDSDSSSSESSHSSSSRNESKKRALNPKQKEILAKKRRLGQSTLCFKHLTGECRFSDCIFRHVKTLDPSDRAEFLKELQMKPFEAKLSEFAKSQNIPLCKAFNKNSCKHPRCQFWHLEDERTARWAGYDFFCALCRRAFTSQVQLDEHKLGKLHRSNHLAI